MVPQEHRKRKLDKDLETDQPVPKRPIMASKVSKQLLASRSHTMYVIIFSPCRLVLLNPEAVRQTIQVPVESVSAHSNFYVKLFPVHLVAMTVSLLTLPQQFLKQNVISVYMYSASQSRLTAVAIYSVKHVSNQSKHKQSYVRCVNTQVLPHFTTRSYSELSINCKFDVRTKKEAALGQENWENLIATSTGTISPMAVSTLTSNGSLALLARFK